MTTGVIIFTVLYCVLDLAYCFTATSGKMYLRAPNKICLALMFFIFGLIMFTTNNFYSSETFTILLVLALFLSALGDIFLLFDINRGGDFFLCGNICLFSYLIITLIHNDCHIDKFWWIFVALAFIGAMWAFILFKFKDKFRIPDNKHRIPIIFYLCAVSMHALASIAVMIYVPGFVLTSVGCIMFMLSDFVIIFDRFYFKNNPWSLRANGLLYFTGILLIVLNMAVTI